MLLNFRFGIQANATGRKCGEYFNMVQGNGQGKLQTLGSYTRGVPWRYGFFLNCLIVIVFLINAQALKKIPIILFEKRKISYCIVY